jgi:hypothetical protein
VAISCASINITGGTISGVTWTGGITFASPVYFGTSGTPGTDAGSTSGGPGGIAGSISCSGGIGGNSTTFNMGGTGGNCGTIDMNGGPGTNATAFAVGIHGGAGGTITVSGGGTDGSAGGGNGGTLNMAGGAGASSVTGLNGGNINTSAGGGSIDTTGTGTVQFGVAGTRTTMNGAAVSNITLTLPIATGNIPVFTGTSAPGSSGATGTPGEIRVSGTVAYLCTATNTWVKWTVVNSF